MSGVNPAALKSLLYGIRDVFVGGTRQPLRPAINLIGVSCVDNAGQNRLDITVSGGGGSGADGAILTGRQKNRLRLGSLRQR